MPNFWLMLTTDTHHFILIILFINCLLRIIFPPPQCSNLDGDFWLFSIRNIFQGWTYMFHETNVRCWRTLWSLWETKFLCNTWYFRRARNEWPFFLEKCININMVICWFIYLHDWTDWPNHIFFVYIRNYRSPCWIQQYIYRLWCDKCICLLAKFNDKIHFHAISWEKCNLNLQKENNLYKFGSCKILLFIICICSVEAKQKQTLTYWTVVN